MSEQWIENRNNISAHRFLRVENCSYILCSTYNMLKIADHRRETLKTITIQSSCFPKFALYLLNRLNHLKKIHFIIQFFSYRNWTDIIALCTKTQTIKIIWYIFNCAYLPDNKHSSVYKWKKKNSWNSFSMSNFSFFFLHLFKSFLFSKLKSINHNYSISTNYT